MTPRRSVQRVAPPEPLPQRPRPAQREQRGRHGAAVVAAALVCLLPACGGSASPADTQGSSAASGTSGAASASASPTLSSGATPSETGSASPSARESASATAESDVRTLRITVTGKRVTPAPARVDLASGERLRLVITVDHDDVVHVHGFEVERDVTAGEPVTIDLTGGEPGLYEVESHHPELRLLQVLVR